MKGSRPLHDYEVQRYLDYLKNCQDAHFLSKLPEIANKRYAKRDRAWFAYGVCCGFRITELMSLTIKDVSHKYIATEYATLRARYSKGKPINAKPKLELNQRTGKIRKVKPKNKSVREGRTLPVESWAMDIMQDWLDELKANKTPLSWFVFQSQTTKNKSLSRQQAYDILVNNCSEIGIYQAIGTHSMRKTFTDVMDDYFKTAFREGHIKDPEKALMEAGGWKHAETMDHYRSYKHTWKREKEAFNVKS